MFQSDISKAFLIICFVAFPTIAQTSSDLHQKYKTTAAVESFEVRQGIIATFYYREDGQVYEVLVRSRLFYMDDLSKKEMSLKVADEILNELVPVEKRGNRCEDWNGFESGRNKSMTYTYENVTIHRLEHNVWFSDASVSTMEVYMMEHTYCPAKAPKRSSKD